MLTQEQKYVLYLLRKSLGVQTEETAEPEDLKSVAGYVVRTGILLTVYHSLPPELQEELKRKYNAALKQSIVQDYEGERVLGALGAAGMKCIALKGWEFRKLYPQTTMRQMSDLDILVKPYDYGKIRTEMEKLGFQSKKESSWKHDSFIRKDVNVEMHKRLTDDSGQIRKWEQDMWTRTPEMDGMGIFRMSPEDFHIFHFIHMYKDFLNGRFGLRRIADTWLLRKLPADTERVKAELQSFGMGTFYERMTGLSRAAMGEEPLDDDCEHLLRHAFAYGLNGTDKSYKAGRITRMGSSLRSGRIHSALAAVFLPYKRMKAHFPVVEKWPVLLPWCWLRRIFQLLRKNKKKKLLKLDYRNIQEEDVEEMKRFFEAGGVKLSGIRK